ncbi:peptidase inhibitor family I36 protein [Nonomuraea sp. KM90]|uniref:peptidase inhibitor family I36 protein n=1 Tax=Nonomuraea sp. KM90 TaxID=3457428 RepID=UPI003FCE668B
MHRKIAISVGVLALGAATLFGPSASASATSEQVGMQAAYFWLFEHDNKQGGVIGFTGDDKDLANNDWWGEPGRSAEYNASSMDNDTARSVLLWVNGGTSCSGRVYLAVPNSEDRDLTNNNFDNLASCVDFL